MLDFEDQRTPSDSSRYKLTFCPSAQLALETFFINFISFEAELSHI